MNLLKYWEAEQQSPRWLRESNDVWRISQEDYLEFCGQCWKIYDLDDAMLYVERFGDRAEIHINALPEVNIENLVQRLIDIRKELFRDVAVVFGWVLRQNKGVQRICRQLGMEFYGVTMLHGESHGRVLEWRCYSVDRSEFFLNIDRKNLLSLK